jgi:hypothetical protein
VTDVPADTTPEVHARFHDLLMQRSGEERMRMASDIFSRSPARLINLARRSSDPIEGRVRFSGGRAAILTRTAADVIADLRRYAAVTH